MITVATPAAITRLSTLDRAKTELGETGTANDAEIGKMLAEAGALAETYCGRVFARQTYSERLGPGRYSSVWLRRWPVVSLTSITLDGTAQDLTVETTYLLDGATGELRALSDGYPSAWCAAKSLVVVYAAGYLLPEQAGRDLPADIESAVLALLRARWRAKGRDPNLRQITTEGVGSETFWISDQPGTSLPPEVEDMLAPYRMPVIA